MSIFAAESAYLGTIRQARWTFDEIRFHYPAEHTIYDPVTKATV